jgi:hypothetical protein
MKKIRRLLVMRVSTGLARISAGFLFILPDLLH